MFTQLHIMQDSYIYSRTELNGMFWDFIWICVKIFN